MQEQKETAVKDEEAALDAIKEKMAEAREESVPERFPGLTPGRNVHFVESQDDHFAAIVAKVNHEGSVNLFIFNANTSKVDYRAAVPFDAEAKERRTWHWIEPA